MLDKTQTPGAVLKSFMDEYNINVFTLSKQTRIGYQTIFKLLRGETKITAQIALLLAKYFKTTPEFWLNIQMVLDLDRLKNNENFMVFLKTIPKAKKKGEPVAKPS